MARISESHVVAWVRLALGCEPDLTLWRNNTGKLRDERGRWVQFGLGDGGADLVGILAPTGRVFALEAKRTGARTDPEREQKQHDWRVLVRSRGGFACKLTADSQPEAARLAHEALARARRGESE